MNAANSSLLGGGGVDGAIHRAGGPEILADAGCWAAVRRGRPRRRGVAAGAFCDPHRRPLLARRREGEGTLLTSCYRRALEVAAGLVCGRWRSRPSPAGSTAFRSTVPPRSRSPSRGPPPRPPAHVRAGASRAVLLASPPGRLCARRGAPRRRGIRPGLHPRGVRTYVRVTRHLHKQLSIDGRRPAGRAASRAPCPGAHRRGRPLPVRVPLLIGPAEGEFAWHEISTRVNRVANDDPQLLLPITDEERAAEEPKPKKIAARKTSPIASDDEGQGSLF